MADKGSDALFDRRNVSSNLHEIGYVGSANAQRRRKSIQQNERPLSSRHIKANDGCLTEPSVDKQKAQQNISTHEILKPYVDNNRRESLSNSAILDPVSQQRDYHRQGVNLNAVDKEKS